MSAPENQASRPDDARQFTGAETAPATGAEASPPPDDDANGSLLAEFFWFVRDNKKWWLIPLVIVVAVLAGLIFLSANPATAPFIYTLF